MSRKIPKQVIEAVGASPDSEAVSTVLRFLAERGHLMTPDQCAAFLQIEVGTLYVMKHQRRIPTARWGTCCASTWLKSSSGPSERASKL
jgi:hypothetical protein